MVHIANAIFPIYLSDEGIETRESFSAPRKAPPSMACKEFGSDIARSRVQPLKADFPMTFKEGGKEILTSLAQFLNARSGIETVPAGISI